MSASPSSELRQRLPARPQSVSLARRAVAEFAAAQGVADSDLWAVRLAVSEAVTNAIVHANAGADDAGGITIEADVCDGALRVVVSDEGGGLRPRTDSPGVGLGLGMIATVTERVELVEMNPGLRVMMAFAIASR